MPEAPQVGGEEVAMKDPGVVADLDNPEELFKALPESAWTIRVGDRGGSGRPLLGQRPRRGAKAVAGANLINSGRLRRFRRTPTDAAMP